jgi:hypothetical protein
VDATSAAFNELCGRVDRDAELGRLHFPVGGKRFWPCLEDLVEMLIVEGLVSGRDGWQARPPSIVPGSTGSNSRRQCVTTLTPPERSSVASKISRRSSRLQDGLSQVDGGQADAEVGPVTAEARPGAAGRAFNSSP